MTIVSIMLLGLSKKENFKSILFYQSHYVYEDSGLSHSPFKIKLPHYREKHEIIEEVELKKK